MTCVVSDPNAEVRWKENGTTVTRRAHIERKGEKSTFVMENVKPEDSGCYACEAVNLAGSALSLTVEIKVMGKLAYTAGEVFVLFKATIS